MRPALPGAGDARALVDGRSRPLVYRKQRPRRIYSAALNSCADVRSSGHRQKGNDRMILTFSFRGKGGVPLGPWPFGDFFGKAAKPGISCVNFVFSLSTLSRIS